MDLIIDGGSSHSRWVTVDNNSQLDSQTLDGINPLSNKASDAIILDYNSPYIENIQSVYFYGSGMSSEEIKINTISLLSSKFPNASISVESDIIAACKAVSHDTESIVSILGTGVNTVLYKDQKVTQSIKSLGHLIAEEGSGYNIGRLVVKYYLRNRMSTHDENTFTQMYLEENNDLITKIYTHQNPKFYVAQFSKFLNVSSIELKKEILNKNFMSYIKNHVTAIDNYQNYKINFVGSIAYRFEQELRVILKEYSLESDLIIDDPMDRLIEYHRKSH